jgi:hypothetical protein
VTLADQRLLLEFARLMLRIGHAQNPLCVLDVTEKTVTRTKGYKRLRAFHLSLSPRPREIWRKQLRAQIDGVKAMEKLARDNDEPFSLGDIVIELFDAESRKPIRAEDAPVLAPAEPDAPTVQATEHDDGESPDRNTDNRNPGAGQTEA